MQGILAKGPPDPGRLVLGAMLGWGWGVTAEEGGWGKENGPSWKAWLERCQDLLPVLDRPAPFNPPLLSIPPTFSLSHPRIQGTCLLTFYPPFPGTWRPRRSIVFVSWGAEEFGLIGSTEFTEVSEPAGERGDPQGGAAPG